jgi:hypothetical protein
MKAKICLQIIYAAASLFMISCNVPQCRNTNPVFENSSPDSEEYKAELAKQMRTIGTKNLSFRHVKYLKKQGAEYILVNITGEGVCALAEVQVTNWEKISGLRKEVSGYSGAELQGLDIELAKDSTGMNFVFKNIDGIID